ncbi:acyltransferase [Paenibacillus sp. V4I7]|uniref:acyltransferase family protein n=1 Tax=Paenibacillus sp. V4I7 TaxID=3042307 RepID=UPI0027839FA6|nr:acyltransferase [Paenibacillus sp. V4I7]MDQ0903971.1 peptidoglycan/LPS O-acetylase OafA/YrhL [Paenibacillus sp. V4I7]
MWTNFRKIDSLLTGKVSIYLDFIRGIAAILVLMEHLSPMLFAYANEGSVIKMLYIFNLLGGASVRIFFILSGLFISRSILKAIDTSSWSWSSYLINRFCRLYVVLVPALLITFILDWLGSIFWGTPYGNAKDNLATFIGNLFFLQEIYVEPFGTNHPLWSLSCEFWYYVLFPLLLLMVKRGTKKSTRIIYLGLSSLIFIMIGIKISFYFLIWLMGTLILFLPIISPLKNRLVLITSFLIFCSASLLRPLVLTGKILGDKGNIMLYVDIFIGLAFVLFTYALLNFYSKDRNINIVQSNTLFERISRLLANFSFSLYLIHQPILNFVHGWALAKGFSGLKPSFLSFTIEVILVFIMLGIAWLFSMVTEANTQKLRRLIVKFIKQKSVTRLQNKKEIST